MKNRLDFFSIREISFQEIKIFWSKNLWPGRESAIEPVSCINSVGEIDINLQNFSPTFFGLFVDTQIAGAISTCQTSANEFRVRGICIISEYRGQGFSAQLMKAALENILKTNKNPIAWTLAREVNLEFYNKFGFFETKRISKYEFGPHIILKNDKIASFTIANF